MVIENLRNRNFVVLVLKIKNEKEFVNGTFLKVEYKADYAFVFVRLIVFCIC